MAHADTAPRGDPPSPPAFRLSSGPNASGAPLPFALRVAREPSAAGGRLAALRAWFALRRLRKGGKADGTKTASAHESGAAKGSISSASSSGASSVAPSSASSSPRCSPLPSAPAVLGTQGAAVVECPLCLCEMTPLATSDSSSASSSPLPQARSSRGTAAWPPDLLTACRHLVCLSCWQSYLRVQINESQVPISCPACAVHLHPDDVARLLASLPDAEEAAALLAKYELYMVRRVLANVPDARWCPAPDCNFAIIAERCERCPRLKCLRPGCGTVFCFRCKQLWHPGKTCKTARAAHVAEVLSAIDPIEGEVKKCPDCGMHVLKMNDGTCNHMVCNICDCEFCWLCMSKVGDMHFLSPSGCTFWGRKPWSRRKRLFLQIATLVGAPVGIAILAGLAVPALTFGIPVWAGRRAVRNLEEPDIHKLRLNAVLAVFFSFMLSPFIAAVVVGVGVPVLFAYVYTVVPVALCRSLESACTCADVRERFLDCLEGSLEDLHRRASLDADEAAEVDASGSDASGTVSGIRARLRRWLQRLRGEDSVVGERRRRRRSGGRSSRRKRREGKAGEEEGGRSGDDTAKSVPSSSSPSDMLRLESLLLSARAETSGRVPAEEAKVEQSGDSPRSSQRLRVLVHAEMPPPSCIFPQGTAEEPELSPAVCLDPVSSSCPSRCATPMTAVDIDAPICANASAAPTSASSPPSPLLDPSSRRTPSPVQPSEAASVSAAAAATPASSLARKDAADGRELKTQRSKSLEMDHELLMLRHLSLDEERLARSLRCGDSHA